MLIFFTTFFFLLTGFCYTIGKSAKGKEYEDTRIVMALGFVVSLIIAISLLSVKIFG